MQVLLAIVLAFGYASALGSGPYLPSGWRPQGPSFYLPSEVANPQKENLFQETEASGSDALREYGPPKLEEVVQVNTNQGLPDVVTEQTFYVQSLATQELVSALVEDGIQATTEQVAALVEEVATATEAQLAEIAVEEQTTDIPSEVQPTFDTEPVVVAEFVEQSEVQEAVTGKEKELIIDSTVVTAQEEAVVPTAVAAEEIVVSAAIGDEAVVVPTMVQDDIVVPTAIVEQIVVEKVPEGVNSIAEALVNLDKEVKAAEALQSAVEIKTEITGSLEQAPEGFLEYGPPGFREYGPPKQDDLARSAAVQVSPTSAFENNEVRRRRFSPKFKPHKKH